MADRRYLKQRRQGWYFHMTVPVDVQAHFGGKTVVTISLKTRDLTKAQRDRWQHVRDWRDRFERVRGNVAITRAEIEEQALATFKRFLVEAEEASKAGQSIYSVTGQTVEDPHTGEQEEAHPEIAGLSLSAGNLENAIEREDFNSVATAIEQVEQRTGSPIPKDSTEYRELALALMRAELRAMQGRSAALMGQPVKTPESFGVTTVDPVTLQRVSHGKPKRPKLSTGDGVPFSQTARQFIEYVQRDPAAKRATRG